MSHPILIVGTKWIWKTSMIWIIGIFLRDYSTFCSDSSHNTANSVSKTPNTSLIIPIDVHSFFLRIFLQSNQTSPTLSKLKGTLYTLLAVSQRYFDNTLTLLNQYRPKILFTRLWELDQVWNTTTKERLSNSNSPIASKY